MAVCRFAQILEKTLESFCLCLRLKGLLVEEILAETFAHSAQVGYIVRKLLDGLHLLSQVVGLEKIGKLRVVVLGGDCMQIQQRLVHGLLQLERRFHRFQARAPLLLDRTWNVGEHDATAPLVLECHQLFSVFAFLFAGLFEKLFKTWQSDIVAVEVESLNINIGG